MLKFANVGATDRVLRFIVGVLALTIGFAALGLPQGEIAGIIAAVVGVLMLLTSAIGFCPAYLPFKLSTCKVRAD